MPSFITGVTPEQAKVWKDSVSQALKDAVAAVGEDKFLNDIGGLKKLLDETIASAERIANITLLAKMSADTNLNTEIFTDYGFGKDNVPEDLQKEIDDKIKDLIADTNVQVTDQESADAIKAKIQSIVEAYLKKAGTELEKTQFVKDKTRALQELAAKDQEVQAIIAEARELGEKVAESFNAEKINV